MPRRCLVCFYVNRKNDGISMHQLPNKEDLRHSWLQNLNWVGPLDNKRYYICSTHFPPTQFRKRSRLALNELPNVTDTEIISTCSASSPKTVGNEEVPDLGAEELVIEEADFVETLSSSETLSLSSPSKCESCSSDSDDAQQRLRKRRRPIHIGEYKAEDLKDPFLQQQYFALSKYTITKLKQEKKNLQLQIFRLKRRVLNLKQLVTNLKKNSNHNLESNGNILVTKKKKRLKMSK